MSKRSELRDQLVQRELSSVWPQWSISNYIGSGSFGDVYEIFREENGKVYKSALKVIRVSAKHPKCLTIVHFHRILRKK